MGQLLIVQGEEDGPAAGLFRRGLAAFETLSGLRPIDQLAGSWESVAVFPRLKAQTPGIVRASGDAGWICGAGNWFFQGVAGEPGLQKLAAHPHRSAAPERWLDEIDAAFAIACSDGVGRFQIITDRLGTIQIYAAEVGACVAVSTSSLVLAAIARPDWDPIGCREFIANGNIFESRTLFKGIEKLPPATVFSFERGKSKSRKKYWNLGDYMWDRSRERGDVPKLAAALKDALDMIGRNYSRPLVDLTGGFDSRAIAGAMLQAGRRFETVVNGRDRDPDVIVSRQIAARFGFQHHHGTGKNLGSVAQWWQETKAALPVCEGECDILQYAPTFALHKDLAEKFEATVNGSNGEICRGYWWELLFPYTGMRGHFDEQVIARSRFVTEAEPPLFAQPFSESAPDLFAGIIRRTNAGLEDYPNTAKLDNVYLTMRMQRWHGRLASATARVWPCLSPFAFRRPIEVSVAAPASVRVRNRMSRRLIEHQNPELAALPLSQGYPALPLRLTTAHRFRPLAVEIWGMGNRYISRRLGIRRPAPPSTSTYYAFSFSQLWEQEEEVRQMLNPACMASGDLYDHGKLSGWIEQARTNGFAKPHHFGRILSIEMVARALRTPLPKEVP